MLPTFSADASYQAVVVGISGIALVYMIAKRTFFSNTFITKLTGPPASWLWGNIHEISETEAAGDRDRPWTTEYGTVFKLQGLFGDELIYLADPKAMHFIFENSTFGRINVKLVRLLLGPNLLGVDAKNHARQRKLLNPGFAQSQIRDLVPVFSQISDKVAEQWKERLIGKSSLEIDIHSWLSRLALDAVGKGVLSYDFGALSETPSEFIEAYRNVFINVFSKRSRAQKLLTNILFRLPFKALVALRSLAFNSMSKMTRLQVTANKIVNDVIQRETQLLHNGAPETRDIMSILVRAKLNKNVNEAISEEELISQIMAIVVAGHDTTAASLCWAFYELARHPEAQEKIRLEVMAFRERSGGRELQASDFDHFPYTTAVIKETLRLYPVATHAGRQALSDTIIPLSKPIRTATGQTTSAIPIKKGQVAIMGLWSYNRSKEIWGNDADEWNPARFLATTSGQDKHTLGVYANLATFSGGVYGCIGWRFAVYEMHSILINLVEKFEFGLSTRNLTIIPKTSVTIFPAVKGEVEKGAQLPLTIKAV